MSDIESMTEKQLDVLKEIGNIGSAHAATALSMLLGDKIAMEVPAVQVVTYNEMFDLVGGAEENIVSVFLRIEGDIQANMFFILTPDQADYLALEVTEKTNLSNTELSFDQLAHSSIKEIGNILAGSYLTALADFTDQTLQPSVPILASDMAGAILAEGLMTLSDVSDYAIIIETIIENESKNKQQIKGHFLLLPDPDSFPKLFNQLGVTGQ